MVNFTNPLRNILVGVTGAAMLISTAACESGSTDSASQAQSSSKSQSSPNAGGASGSGEVLVAYFSATGHTADVAKSIANATNGDLFEITPQQPYSDGDLDWNDESSRVVREHADEKLRDVPLKTTTPDGWDSYETVFIGYPIWWGGAAWPVDHFVSDNDFSGKTVIPFATSASSELGSSATQLKALTSSGDWQSGKRFPSSASSSDVADWVASPKL